MLFAGFSTDDPVKLPQEFFTDVLPHITSTAELKVTLHLFFLLKTSRRRPRMVEWNTLLSDATLAHSLRTSAPFRPLEDVLVEGVEAAVRRGTLLHVLIPDGPRVGNWYLAHTAPNYAWAVRVMDGDVSWLPSPALAVERPSIFALYEQNIGVLTPLLALELREAEQSYPAVWINDAIREAVRSNKRSWRYIRAILDRWQNDGRRERGGGPTNEDFRQYVNDDVYELFDTPRDNS